MVIDADSQVCEPPDSGGAATPRSATAVSGRRSSTGLWRSDLDPGQSITPFD